MNFFHAVSKGPTGATVAICADPAVKVWCICDPGASSFAKTKAKSVDISEYDMAARTSSISFFSVECAIEIFELAIRRGPKGVSQDSFYCCVGEGEGNAGSGRLIARVRCGGIAGSLKRSVVPPPGSRRTEMHDLMHD